MAEVTDARGETRTRIVEAAARLLQEHGAAAVTTRGVAESAGVQAPTIYRLFGDKHGLLDAVAEHVFTTYVAAKTATVDALTDDVDPVDDLRTGWNAQIDFGLANPMLTAMLSDPDRGARSPAAVAGRAVLARRVHRIALAGRLCVSETRAADLVHAAGTGAVLTLLATPADRRDLGVADDLFDAVLEQILTESSRRDRDGRRAAVIAVRALAPDLDALTVAERELLAEWLGRVIS